MSTTRTNLTLWFAAWLLLGLVVGNAGPLASAVAPLGGADLWLRLIPAACLAWVRMDWIVAAADRILCRPHTARRGAPTRFIRV